MAISTLSGGCNNGGGSNNLRPAREVPLADFICTSDIRDADFANQTESVVAALHLDWTTVATGLIDWAALEGGGGSKLSQNKTGLDTIKGGGSTPKTNGTFKPCFACKPLGPNGLGRNPSPHIVTCVAATNPLAASADEHQMGLRLRLRLELLLESRLELRLRLPLDWDIGGSVPRPALGVAATKPASVDNRGAEMHWLLMRHGVATGFGANGIAANAKR